jgi:DNA-directed RNA polymerase specialized sigma24 family protein
MSVGTQRLCFADFYRRTRDDCLRTVLISLAGQDTAQELVAEAFAQACASWRTVSRHPAPAAWVVRTALNMTICRWRRRRRELSVPDPARSRTCPQARTFGQPFDPPIKAALMRLSARQRQVVAMRLLLDLDTARTAHVLGITRTRSWLTWPRPWRRRVLTLRLNDSRMRLCRPSARIRPPPLRRRYKRPR